MAMKTATLNLPDGNTLTYHIRVSNRAKYLRMQYSAAKGLIVTQPGGVCEHQLTEWVQSKRDWISRALAETEQAGLPTDPYQLPPLPETIHFPVLNETVRVIYKPGPGQQMSTDYEDDSTLTLTGPVDKTAFCIHVLQQWTQGYAKYHLGYLLQQTAQETGFSYNSYRVKAQKTRWGSCSAKGNINLNYKLLLMPAEWLRYTLIHELCHTREMNHSRRFWALLEKHMPDYQRAHNAMKQADKRLPAWANYTL